MNTKAIKQRIDFRINEDQKDLIEEAALLSGETTTSFAISTLIQRSRDVIQSHRSTMLSKSDSLKFLEILDNDEPNTKLKNAFRKYRQHHGK
jgi:uncharacterized protein (DUF1778 family)